MNTNMRKELSFLSIIIAILFICNCSLGSNHINISNKDDSPTLGTYQISLSTITAPYPDSTNQTITNYQDFNLSNQSKSSSPSSKENNIILPPAPPSSAPKPSPGKASISGALFSNNSKIRIASTVAYLTLAQGEKKEDLYPILVGPEPNIGDITFITDQMGNFVVENIPPGRYFMIVWAPYSWKVVRNIETDNGAKLLDLMADQNIPLGVLYVPWP